MVKSKATATKGPIGGAAGEAGSDFRAGVAAWAVVHGLAGADLPGMDLRKGRAVPDQVALETDDPVDDVTVSFVGGGHAYFQAKAALTFDSSGPFAKAGNQWMEAAGRYNPKRDRIVLCASSLNGALKTLSAALARRRDEGASKPSPDEDQQLQRLKKMLSHLDKDDLDNLLDVLIILELRLDTDGAADAGLCSALLGGHVVSAKDGGRAWDRLKHHAKTLARKRSSRRLLGWVSDLRDAGFTIKKSAAERFPEEGPALASPPSATTSPPTLSAQAERVLEKALAEPHAGGLRKKLKLLGAGDADLVIERLVGMAPVSVAAVEVVARLEGAGSDVAERCIGGVTLLGGWKEKVAVLLYFDTAVLDATNDDVLEAFFGDVLEIVERDRFDEVNDVVPALAGRIEAIPEALWERCVLALLRQSRSSSFRGAPAARRCLQEVPAAMAVAGLRALDVDELRWTLHEKDARAFVQKHVAAVGGKKQERLSDFLNLSYREFLEKYFPND